jgi:hypothetical protein
LISLPLFVAALVEQPTPNNVQIPPLSFQT